MQNVRLDESQAGIKISRRNNNNLRYSDDIIHCRKWSGTKELLDEGERREWKKLAWKSTFRKLRSWYSIPSLHASRRGKSGSSGRFYFLGLQNHEDGDYSHEIQRHLLLGRKAMINLYSVLKSTDTTLPIKVRIVKAMIFPVVMCGCESWTLKDVECWIIDAFALSWKRLLRVPWTTRKSNQSILKETNWEYSLGGLMLKLKL